MPGRPAVFPGPELKEPVNLFLIYQSNDQSNICYLANGLDFNYVIKTLHD